MGNCAQGMKGCMDADGDGDIDLDDLRLWATRGATQLKTVVTTILAVQQVIAAVDPDLAGSPAFAELGKALGAINDASEVLAVIADKDSKFNQLSKALTRSIEVLSNNGDNAKGPTDATNALHRINNAISALDRLGKYLETKAPEAVQGEMGQINSYINKARLYIATFENRLDETTTRLEASRLDAVHARKMGTTVVASTSPPAIVGSVGLEDVELGGDELVIDGTAAIARRSPSPTPSH
ncbi:MAG: hypothetical protein HON32_04755 [Francisellaceae bacterium]|nr:hypothetical protein [Francisellaceae bacterium]